MNKRTKRYLFSLSLIAILLLTSWIIPRTHLFWNFLDEFVYKTLHYNVLKTHFQQQFWAIMNSRIADNISQACMLILLVRYIFTKSDNLLRSTKIKHVIFIIVTVVASVIISKTTQSRIANTISIKRDSPSLVHGHYVALSEVIPGLDNVKDSSRRSFPGDHAMTLILFALYFLYFMKNKFLKYIPILIAIFFSLPRIISGGHWLTDTIMGSFSIAVFFFVIWLSIGIKTGIIEEANE